MPIPGSIHPIASPGSDRTSNRSTRRATHLVLVRGIAALTLALLPCSNALRAQTPEPDSIDALTVLVHNFVGVPPATLAAAERHADKILGAAGAHINWIPCPDDGAPNAPEPCRDLWSGQTPGLRLIAGENKFQSDQFGYTAIPIYSTIYYQRIVARAHRDNIDDSVSILLGCVIAHELGHLLLRAPGHSPKGIMQPVWGPAQIREALTGKLLFTKSESTRIQSQARTLASLPRTAPRTDTP